MAKNDPIERKLNELADLRGRPVTAAQIEKYLSDRSNLVVSKAARLAGESKAMELAPALVKAFWRFMDRPESTDKGCTAKTAIVKALNALECGDAEVYRRGLRHVQLEPGWGGAADSAAELRGESAIGLVQMNWPDALVEVLPLLVDKERLARVGAARA